MKIKIEIPGGKVRSLAPYVVQRLNKRKPLAQRADDLGRGRRRLCGFGRGYRRDEARRDPTQG